MTHASPPSLRELDDPKLESLVEVMFLAAFADGEFSDEERKHFAKSVESLTDRRVRGETIDKLIARMEKDFAGGEGRDACLAGIKAKLADQGSRKAAFALAIQVVAADGIVRTSERELLFDLAEGLEIDRDAAADMVREIAG